MYALGSHFKSELCVFSVDTEKIPLPYFASSRFRGRIKSIFSSQKGFSVPCILTCFKHLVSPAGEFKRNSPLFDKLTLALTYSSQLVQPISIC